MLERLSRIKFSSALLRSGLVSSLDLRLLLFSVVEFSSSGLTPTSSMILSLSAL